MPLDSYTLKGIKCDCKNLKIEFQESDFKNFSIISLDKIKSNRLQRYATKISEGKNTCRVNLDLEYWRNDNDD